jgi:hypothetical protein
MNKTCRGSFWDRKDIWKSSRGDNNATWYHVCWGYHSQSVDSSTTYPYDRYVPMFQLVPSQWAWLVITVPQNANLERHQQQLLSQVRWMDLCKLSAALVPVSSCVKNVLLRDLPYEHSNWHLIGHKIDTWYWTVIKREYNETKKLETISVTVFFIKYEFIYFLDLVSFNTTFLLQILYIDLIQKSYTF